MNLVAKEYVAAQDAADPGVLILSRFAGAAAEFKEGALLVNPYDPDAVAAAIANAMAMPLAERKSRHNALFAALLRNDISKWGDKFLSALMGTKEFKLKDGALASRAKFQGISTRH
jgi:trehalose 6-phosphate synthase